MAFGAFLWCGHTDAILCRFLDVIVRGTLVALDITYEIHLALDEIHPRWIVLSGLYFVQANSMQARTKEYGGVLYLCLELSLIVRTTQAI